MLQNMLEAVRTDLSQSSLALHSVHTYPVSMAKRFLSGLVLVASLAGCAASDDLARKGQALTAIDLRDPSVFLAAAKCKECSVLALSSIRLPETKVDAATAKLQSPDGRSYLVTLRKDGLPADEAKLLSEERAKRAGRQRSELAAWTARAGAGERAWVWIWTTAVVAAPRREDLLKDASLRAAHNKAVSDATATATTSIAEWLRLRSIEVGDRGGPLLRARLTASEARELATNPSVGEMGLDSYPGKREGTPWGASSMWGPSLRLDAAHPQGTGTGARICVKEDTQPDTYSRLTVSAIANPSGPASAHTRAAAGILRNTDAAAFPWRSVAPTASIYIANWAGYNGSADDWCRAQATNTISYSYSVLGASSGPLSGTDMAHDWLAKNSPYVLVVAAAGERDPNISNGWFVRNRGFNGLVVGGVLDQNSVTRKDDRPDPQSAYGNPTTPHGDYELPHVVAPTNSLDSVGTSLSGTSASTAMVAGISAIVDSIDPGLSSWPEGKRAIITATATGRAGLPPLTSLPASSDAAIGAGVVNAEKAAMLAQPGLAADAYGATTVAADGRLARTVTFGSDFDASGYLTARWKARAATTGRLRVVLTFDATASCVGGVCASDTPDADLDLHLFKKTDGTWTATGALSCASSTYDSTWELCDIPVVAGEEYLIAVKKWSTTSNSTYVGVAWHNYVPATDPSSDAAGPLAVTSYWAPEFVGSLSSSASLSAVVRNNTASTISGVATILSHGFDGRTAERSLGALTLSPNEIRSISVPVANLPIRSVGPQATAEITFSYTSGGEASAVASHPVFYQFQSGLATAEFFGGAPKVAPISPQAPLASLLPLVPALFTYEGTVWNGTANNDISVVRSGDPPSPGGRPARSEAVIGGLAGLFDLTTHLATETPSPATLRVCTTWRARFDDSKAEDYYTGTGPEVPARYSQAKITDTGGVVIWEGQLSKSGCSPFMIIAPGNYVLWQTTYFQKSGAKFNVFYNDTGGIEKAGVLFTGFERTTSSGAETIYLHPTDSDPATTVAAIVAQLLSLDDSDTLLTAGVTYRLHADQVSPTGANAVTEFGELFVSKNADPRLAHNAYFKYVVGHELGHVMQEFAFGFPLISYDFVEPVVGPPDSGVPLIPQCSCVHVLPTELSKHCLTGVEFDSDGQNEGFAHAFAARLWNNPAEENCSFTYYKNGWSTFGAVPPPFVRSCKGPVAGVGWQNTFCPGTLLAVEHDWLNYHWEMSSLAPSQRTSFSELGDMYRRACNQSTGPTSLHCNNDKRVHWNVNVADLPDKPGTGSKSLVWAAERVYQDQPAKKDAFILKAADFGVNH